MRFYNDQFQFYFYFWKAFKVWATKMGRKNKLPISASEYIDHNRCTCWSSGGGLS